MNTVLSGEISSVGEFLAHALEMEVESAERYRELADAMQVHNNPQVAALFRTLAAEGHVHAQQVMQHAAGEDLPDIAPWAFKWTSPDGPESAPLDEVHYLMSRRQALQLALHNESRGHAFYLQVAEGSANAEVRQLAAEMAAEEGAHVQMLRQWLAQEGDSEPVTQDDLDPPCQPG